MVFSGVGMGRWRVLETCRSASHYCQHDDFAVCDLSGSLVSFSKLSGIPYGEQSLLLSCEALRIESSRSIALRTGSALCDFSQHWTIGGSDYLRCSRPASGRLCLEPFTACHDSQRG